MSSSTQASQARLLIEAAAWRVRLTETPEQPSEAFEAWLAQSEEHRSAWARVQQPWDLIGEHATSPELLEARRAALGRARESSRRRWSGWRHWPSVAAAGMASVLIAAGVLWHLSNGDVYRTQSGERRIVRLADGSQVHLDSLTELRVRYSDDARDLVLSSGQARFDVARDVERPFAVQAGGQKVIATGTSFNVDLLAQDLFVTLLEGRVMVKPQGGAPGTELNAGEQLAVLAGGSTQRSAVNLERAVAWESGQLIFDNEPLSEVIERFNRYSTRGLVLDEAAGELRISGVFNTGDVDGFVSTLTQYLSLRTRESGGVIYLGR